MLETRFFSWHNIIPFPAGGFLMDSTQAETGLEKPQYQLLHCCAPNPERPYRCIIDVKRIAEAYSPKVMNMIRADNPTIHWGTRMREACICSKGGLHDLFVRHQAFMGGFEDLIEQCIVFASFKWWEDHLNRRSPSELRGFFDRKAIPSPDCLVSALDDENLFDTANCDEFYGGKWENDTLGEFRVRPTIAGWDVIWQRTGEVIMGGFLWKLDAQINTESLFCHIDSHPDKELLLESLSALDIVLMDNRTSDEMERFRRISDDDEDDEEDYIHAL